MEQALLAKAERALFGPPMIQPPGAAAPFPSAPPLPPPRSRGAAEGEAAGAGQVLEVTIGRLEVVAPPTPPAPPRRRAPSIHTTLQSYLERRRAGAP